MRLSIAGLAAILSAVSSNAAAAAPEAIALGTEKKFRFKGLALDLRAEIAYLGSWDKKQIDRAKLEVFCAYVLRAEKSRHHFKSSADVIAIRGDRSGERGSAAEAPPQPT